MDVGQEKYDNYKDSGQSWLGHVPTSWDLLRNKALFQEQTAAVGKLSKDYKLLSLTLGGVIPRDMENPKGKFPAEFDTYKKVAPDDLVFCLFDVAETPRAVGRADEAGMITGAYTILRADPSVNSRYLTYYYLSLDYDKRLGSLYTGLRNVIKIDTFMSIRTPVPDLDTQNRIVRFLDEKTAEIDAAVEKKRRLIDLLNEQKAILINRAVTKGLNPDATMKDSGVDWIGEIPAHWDVKRVKHFAEILPGYAFPSAKFSEAETPVRLLRGININPSKVVWQEAVFWPEGEFDGHQRYALQTGDLVMGMDRPWVSSGVRVARISDADLPALLVQRVARIRANDGYSNDFLELLITSKLFLEYFEPILSGVSVPHISDSQIGNFTTAVPDFNEQCAIAEYCRGITSEYGRLMDMEMASITTLNEFKQTLIANAVTGKIKI